MWNTCGRCSWVGKIGFLLISIWLLTIIISINHVFKQHITNPLDNDKNDDVNNEKLQEIITKFQQLKKQNAALKSLLLKNSNDNLIQGDHLGANNENLDKDIVYYDEIGHSESLKFLPGEPSIQYEETRRRIRNDIQEMWYYITGELNKIKKNGDKFDLNKEIEISLNDIDQYKNNLLINVDKINDVDGFDKWREKESRDLANLVQNRFKYLQNPKNCDKARKLICNLNKGCGFGCQLHHVVYCFLVAYGTERTLILKSKGWRYQKEGWDSVFKPVSDSCKSMAGESHANWPGDNTKQVISLPIVDNVYPKPKFQPPAVPADLVPRIQKIHGYPLVWWIGQVLKFLMQPNDRTRLILENKSKKLDFKKPIVGVHVRRTDKVGTEAAFHDLDEYMIKVKQYFDSLPTKPDIKRVFLASDDPKVILTAKKRYPDYEFLGDADIAETASMSRRYSNLSLIGIIIDIHFLSKCDFLVCTFSSQVCRVAYELMQTYHIDAYNRFSSLDDVYYYGGQNPHPQTAIIEHIPKRDGEIELKVGDFVEVHGNHWDGFSKGKNIRTGITGLFPSFKVSNPIKSVEFPKYEMVTSDKS